jgi:carboxypeptidase D
LRGDRDYFLKIKLRDIPAVPFVKDNKNLFNFNETFMAHLDQKFVDCGYKEYIEQFLAYPPPRAPTQDVVGSEGTDKEGCDLWLQVTLLSMLGGHFRANRISKVLMAAMDITNGGFNVYHVTDTWPCLWDVIGGPTGNGGPISCVSKL